MSTTTERPTEERSVDILVSYNDRMRVMRIVPRPDLGIHITPIGLTGIRFLDGGKGFTIPALAATDLLSFFQTYHKDLRVSFTKEAAGIITSTLEREAATHALAIAEDGDVPDVLSVALYSFQRAALAYILRGTPRKILALDTGLGKTAVACAYSRIKQSRTLWITKANLAINLRREIQKLTGQKAIIFASRNPTPEIIDTLQTREHQHIIITYEALALSLVYQEVETQFGTHRINESSVWALLLKNSPIDLCIVDEAHNIKNRETARFKTIKMLSSIPSFLFLTATPVVNNGKDTFSLLNILDSKVYDSETEFLSTYFSFDGLKCLYPKKIQEDLLPYVFRRKKEDVLENLPSRIYNTHAVALEGEDKKRYMDVYRGLYTSIKGEERNVSNNFLAQLHYFRQIVSSIKAPHTAERAKDIEDTGEKCLVFTFFKESAYIIAKELGCEAITGDVSQEERMAMQDRFQDPSGNRSLVLTFDTGREGLTLTAATAILHNDFAWNPMTYDQAEGRAWGRLNDLHGCLVEYVQVENSVDGFMMDLVKNKRTLVDAVVDGQKNHSTQMLSMQKEFMKYVRMHVDG